MMLLFITLDSYLLLIIGLVLLIVGAEGLVKGASEIALRLKISRLVVGLTIVAFGTSAPELFISVKSALADHPEIALGNVVGSNICNITLVLGLTALIFPIRVTADALKVNWTVAMVISLLFFFLVLDKMINWYEGVIYVIMISAYNYYLIKGSRKQAKEDAEISGEIDTGKTFGFLSYVRNIAFIIAGSIALIYGSDWLVTGATDIAESMGISKRVVGITVVAFGTSLPELATSIVAAFRQKADLGLGNLIGSNIFNILSILGITSLVKEIDFNEMFHMAEGIRVDDGVSFIQHDIIWMLIITALLFPVMLTRMRISRWEGLFLLALYSAYMYSLNVQHILELPILDWF